MVKADAVNHLSNEEVKSVLNGIKGEVENFSLDSGIKNLFEFKIEFPNHILSHANFSSIGYFIEKNRNEYFVVPTFTTETYEDIEKPSRWGLATGRQVKPYTITKNREVIDGYSLTAGYPYQQIIVDINSKYPNLASYNCTIAFITSDRKIKLY